MHPPAQLGLSPCSQEVLHFVNAKQQAADEVDRVQFIPNLSHEADGLIFQPWESPYVIGTADDLLKWKFAHLNSVDFKFMNNQGRAP